jgi:heme O synthase-like polyprenyltransferase
VASESILISGRPGAAVGGQSTAAFRAVCDYLALTKPEVNLLIAVATFTGFYLGNSTRSQGFPFLLLSHTLLGTLLVASGTGRVSRDARADLTP